MPLAAPKRFLWLSGNPFLEIEQSDIFKNWPNFHQTHFPRKVGPPGLGNPTAGSASPSQCVGFQNGWEISRYVPLVARNDFLSSGSPFQEIEKSDIFKNRPPGILDRHSRHSRFIPVKWCQGLHRRPTHPHAPGARMTVVNQLPQIMPNENQQETQSINQDLITERSAAIIVHTSLSLPQFSNFLF